MNFVNHTYQNEPPKSTVVLYEVSGFFYEAFFEFITLFVMLYVQLASPIRETLDPNLYSFMLMFITFGLVIIRIGVAFFYTLVGHLLESRHYPFGRYRTFILFGSFTCAFFFILLFFVAPLFSGWMYVAFFLLFYTLMEGCYAINDVAFWSFMNTLTSDEKKRSIISCVLNSISVLGAYLIASISPAITAGDSSKNMSILAAVLVSLYLLSQLTFGIFMKEREETKDFLSDQKETTLLEPMKILFSDKQIFIVIFAFFLLFLAQDCLIGNSTNYFYYEYGYGSFADSGFNQNGNSGGYVSFFFTLAFGIGNMVSYFLYPLLSRKLNKKQILSIFLPIVVLLYLFLFFYAFRRGNEILLYITSFLLSISHGILYTPLFLNCFDSSEYYEYIHGKKRNSSIQSLRTFTVIAANAVQTGLLYFFLFISGLLPVNSAIAELEAMKASGTSFTQLEFITAVNNQISSLSSTNSNTIYLSGLTLLPMMLTIVSVLLTLFLVKVNDESYYVQIVLALEEKKAHKGKNIQ